MAAAARPHARRPPARKQKGIYIGLSGPALLAVLAIVGVAAAWAVLPFRHHLLAGASSQIGDGGHWDITADEARLYDELYAWAHKASGQAPGIRAGRVCRDEGAGRFCMRGAVAQRQFEAGDVIMWLPDAATVQLPQANLDAWLGLLYDTPGFNASFAPYVALLPKPGELLLPATMDEGELAMLQGGPLEATFRRTRRHMEQANLADVANPATVTARHRLTLDQYVLAAATVSTRFWVFEDEASGELHVTMAPLIDMANHADEEAGPDGRGRNARIQHQGGRIQLIALRAISAGSEVAISYEAAQLHRPDIALMRYGYWPRRRPPLLAAHDLPGPEADRLRSMGDTIDTPLDDRTFWAGAQHGTPAELARLRALLAAFPTSEASDRRQLQEDQRLTPRQRALLEFRVERKAALAFVADRLAAGLAAPDRPAQHWMPSTDRLC